MSAHPMSSVMISTTFGRGGACAKASEGSAMASAASSKRHVIRKSPHVRDTRAEGDYLNIHESLERAALPGTGDRHRDPRTLQVREQPLAVGAVAGAGPFRTGVGAGRHLRVVRFRQHDGVLGEL